MRRIVFVALCAALISGCGGAPKTPPPRSLPQPGTFVCHPKHPAQLGECIRQELEAKGRNPRAIAPATVTGRAQGIDISRWQPHPDFRRLHAEGIRFVIVQGADDAHASNPFFDSQIRGAHEAGMAVGVYIFVEGDSSSAQADALIAAARSERSRITLGAHVDAEVPSAYGHACGVALALSGSFHVVSLYSSPGLWFSGRCVGYAWPAEWGSGSAYPLNGYPSSAIKLRQFCGTCVLGGNSGQIDRDEDLGLLALAKPSPPPISRSKRRALVLADLHRHGCFTVHGNAAFRLCPYWGAEWRRLGGH